MLSSELEDYQRKLDRLVAECDHAQRQVADEEAALAKAVVHVQACEKAQCIVQAVAEAVQEAAHQQIACVVTRCLKAVFGDEGYEFQIEFVRKRGRTEANLYFVRDGLQLGMEAVGGGVVDVAAFALRLASLALSLPRRRKLLIADEPFRFVSKEYRPQVKALLETLAEEMGLQIVMVTHSPDLVCGKVIEIS